MKVNKFIFTILVLFATSSCSQVSTNKVDKKPETFTSKMVTSVMVDAYTQYKSNKSINGFIYNESIEKQTFFESFGEANYQGVIEIENFKPYRYYVESAIIYWESYIPKKQKSQIKSGKIDINEFYRDNLNLGSNQKCPMCLWALGIGVAGCVTTVQMCNNRCGNCIYGAKHCSSSCWTNSCEVECYPAPDNTQPALYAGWNTFNDWLLITNNNGDLIDP